MMIFARVLTAAFTLSTLPVLALAAENVDAARGKSLFMANNCYQCHGTMGQGGTGAIIAPPRLPALPAFTAYLRHPAGEMPAFTAKVINDADIASIHAYLASLPPPPDELPDLLKQPLGSK